MGTAAGDVEFRDVEKVDTVVARATDHPTDQLPGLFDATFGALFPALAERGLAPAGAAFALYTRMPGDTVDIEVGVPVGSPLEAPVTVGKVELVPSELPAGTIAATTHVGGYETLGRSWERFMMAISAAGRKPVLPFWEVYVTEPSPDTDPATLRTDLFTLVDSGAD